MMNVIFAIQLEVHPWKWVSCLQGCSRLVRMPRECGRIWPDAPEVQKSEAFLGPSLDLPGASPGVETGAPARLFPHFSCAKCRLVSPVPLDYVPHERLTMLA
jgi:hypothetical protein